MPTPSRVFRFSQSYEYLNFHNYRFYLCRWFVHSYFSTCWKYKMRKDTFTLPTNRTRALRDTLEKQMLKLNLIYASNFTLILMQTCLALLLNNSQGILRLSFNLQLDLQAFQVLQVFYVNCSWNCQEIHHRQKLVDKLYSLISRNIRETPYVLGKYAIHGYL